METVTSLIEVKVSSGVDSALFLLNRWTVKVGSEGCLRVIVFSLPNMRTTDDIVGRSAGSSWTHSSAI